jgi:hypothetical protein
MKVANRPIEKAYLIASIMFNKRFQMTCIDK